ncbi:sugar ABC transporter permease (plasmid) [Rhizobium lusitanum]|nr:sugar ABC transporter permease [Rhizobium lusitanum]QND44540.1 sugar ABC transporter permease [Rhizobium lusitanum]
MGPLKKPLTGIGAHIALAPAWIILIVAYVGTVIWTVQISFTNSKVVPINTFVGLDQYARLFTSLRWLQSLQNMLVFGVLFIGGCLVVGFVLAVLLDQKIKAEGVFRTVFLYPYAVSFIVTGLVWQWILNPTLGLQHAVQGFGWETFTFDWLVRPDRAIFVMVIAGIWQGAGLVMALLLAGLRGVDGDLWKAAKIDGISPVHYYLRIVLPILTPTIASAVVLLALGVVKAYDLVVALTGGGPGAATEMPAKFVMDYLFGRQNLGLATAASTVMLVSVIAMLAPWLYFQSYQKKRKAV